MASDTQKIPSSIKLLCAALGGVAGTLVCFPLDVLKYNMQVAGEGGKKQEQVTAVQFARHIINRDGIKGLYSGLTASMLRQALYTGGRIGAFQVFLDKFSRDGVHPGIFVQAIGGVAAGAFGGIVGLPPDVALTRMAVDKSLPVDRRRNYTHVFNAMGRIVREEGSHVLFRGLEAVVIRAALVNVGQLVTYIQAKKMFIENNILREGTVCHLISSVLGSTVATILSLPADMAKTRMQNMKIIDGKREYANLLDVWVKVIRKEGVFSLWKGFTPMLLRNGPQYVVVFIVYEKLIHYYKVYFVNI